MSKIFGISDLPVSTIMSPFNNDLVPKPKWETLKKTKNIFEKDMFISKTQKPCLKSFVNMRNGIGKLMKHFH